MAVVLSKLDQINADPQGNWGETKSTNKLYMDQELRYEWTKRRQKV